MVLLNYLQIKASKNKYFDETNLYNLSLYDKLKFVI